ncbi:MAG: hypothetical protein GY759_09330 [Chloroflexi bacterium]|nr:hypothetical protein [Chloroflexota bacterium]
MPIESTDFMPLDFVPLDFEILDFETTSSGVLKMQPKSTPPEKTTYEPPRIVHKGKLKQFSGSPISGPPDPDNLWRLP